MGTRNIDMDHFIDKADKESSFSHIRHDGLGRLDPSRHQSLALGGCFLVPVPLV